MGAPSAEPRSPVCQEWAGRLAGFLPRFMQDHPVLAPLLDRSDLVLHGSTTRGIDDDVSDLDVWMLLPDRELCRIDEQSDTRFFEFECEGKAGHVNAESEEDFIERLNMCDFPLIYELRHAEILRAYSVTAESLVRSARRPMSDPVRQAFFFYHFTEMRGEHRSAKNPMHRGEALSTLFCLDRAVAHALKAALILEGQPYPYDKWLAWEAERHPTGREVLTVTGSLLDRLAEGELSFHGPLEENRLNQCLYQIRGTLKHAANEMGVDEPWMEKWWLYMTQARDAVHEVSW